MTCEKCNSNRVLSINGKCSDLCSYSLNGQDGDGYVPSDLGVGGGDYLEFSVCLDCGQAQGTWPLPKSELEESPLEEPTDDPFQEGDVVEFKSFGVLYVGYVEKYDRDEEKVHITLEGQWNSHAKTLANRMHLSGQEKVVSLDDVRKSDKEW